MNVAYLKVTHRLRFTFFVLPFSQRRIADVFHGHSCPSIMIFAFSRKHVRAVTVADAGMACPVLFFVFTFFWATGMVPTLGVGALSKLRTLRIGSGGTACMCVWGGGIYIYL